MKVVVAADATAAAKVHGLDGMLAALTNFTMLRGNSTYWSADVNLSKNNCLAMNRRRRLPLLCRAAERN